MICLSKRQSMRLIARGVAELPEVKLALQSGKIFIARGNTNRYVLEELTGIKEKNFAIGYIKNGKLRTNPFQFGYVIEKGNPVKKEFEIHDKDILIKGANALVNGKAGVLTFGDTGTIQKNLSVKNLIIPVSLNKTVTSLELGEYAHYKIIELRGQIVTEITALKLINNIKAVHLCNGSDGSVILGIKD